MSFVIPKNKSFSLAPPLSLAVFSLSVGLISSLALEYMAMDSSWSATLSTLEGTSALVTGSVSFVLFAISTVWVHKKRREKEKYLRKVALAEIRQRAAGKKERRVFSRTEPLFRVISPEERPAEPTETKNSAAAATMAPPVSEDRRAALITEQTAALKIQIPAFTRATEEFLVALWEADNKETIDDRTRGAINNVAAQLVMLFPIQPEHLEAFYRQGAYPMPLGILGVRDLDRLITLTQKMRNKTAARELEGKREEVLDKIHSINRCARPLELLEDLSSIGKILLFLGDNSPTTQANIAQVDALKRELFAIISSIPQYNEAEITRQLSAYIKKLAPISNIWNRVSIPKPRNERQALLAEYIPILLVDIGYKKSIAPGCLKEAADNLEDMRCMHPELLKVLPHSDVVIDHRIAITFLQGKLIPFLNRFLQEEDMIKKYEIFVQFLMLIQSLGVLSPTQLESIDIAGLASKKSPFSTEDATLSHMTSVTSSTVPADVRGLADQTKTNTWGQRQKFKIAAAAINPGDRGQLFDTVKQVATHVGWRNMEHILGWKSTRQQMALGTIAPPFGPPTPGSLIATLVPVMLTTLFNVIKPESPLRKRVLPILMKTESLQGALEGEKEKDYLDIASVLKIVTDHIREMTQGITGFHSEEDLP